MKYSKPCISGPDAHVRYTVQGIIVRYDGEHITCRKVLTVLREFDPRKEHPDKLNIPVIFVLVAVCEKYLDNSVTVCLLL